MLRQLASALVIAALFPSISFADTSSYSCKYSVEASPKGLAQQKTPFELRYIVDAGSEKSYLMGNNGASEVAKIENVDGVSFVEVTKTGNLVSTLYRNTDHLA